MSVLDMILGRRVAEPVSHSIVATTKTPAEVLPSFERTHKVPLQHVPEYRLDGGTADQFAAYFARNRAYLETLLNRHAQAQARGQMFTETNSCLVGIGFLGQRHGHQP